MSAHGPITFPSIAVAASQGFEIYDRTQSGYVVRKRSSAGFIEAIVEPGVDRRRESRACAPVAAPKFPLAGRRIA